MEVIPSLNCPNLACAAEKLAAFRGLGAPWIHVDVADGRFTPAVLWNDAASAGSLVRAIAERAPGATIEAHLMVVDPEVAAERWLAAGAKRIVVQAETVRDLPALEGLCERHGAELVLSVAYATDIGVLTRLVSDRIASVQVLAVKPGFSGEPLEPAALETIAFLHKRYPSLLIEVDGGVTPETGKAMKAAGADILVSGSSIWNAPDHRKAYQELRKL